MNCKNCGASLTEEAKFCATCGTAVEQEPAAEPVTEPVAEPAIPVAEPAVPVAEPVPAPAVVAQPVAQPAPIPTPVYVNTHPSKKSVTEKDLPEHLRPLSPWAYFGLSILYSIPIVGFIFLIVFSFNRSNINRRNFTRSYWCGLIIVAAILVVFLIISLILGFGARGIIDEMMFY